MAISVPNILIKRTYKVTAVKVRHMAIKVCYDQRKVPDKGHCRLVTPYGVHHFLILAKMFLTMVTDITKCHMAINNCCEQLHEVFQPGLSQFMRAIWR